VNTLQVKALYRLMLAAEPPRKLYEPMSPELHVNLSVAQGADDGNTYEATFWTVEVGYRSPLAFYLCSDGSVYVCDEDGESYEFTNLRWELPPPGKITHTLTVDRKVTT
jgi:hypothetical protein